MTKITEVTHFTATMKYVKLDARKLVMSTNKGNQTICSHGKSGLSTNQ